MRDEPDIQSRRLPELLPEYYRENPGELGSALKIADEIVASVGAHLRRARGRLDDDFLLSLKERWFPSHSPAARPHSGSSERGGGTRRELVRWFRINTGQTPSVWAGFEVRSIGVDRLQLRRSRGLAAVLVLNQKGLSESSRPPSLPPDMVPLRTRLQLMLPLSEDKISVPCHGRVLKARVLFDSRASDVDV